MFRSIETGVIIPPQKDSMKFSLGKKVLAGVGLSGVDFGLSRGIEVIAATEGATVGFMRPIIENHSSAVVLTSALAIGAAITAVEGFQNLRLLKEKKIGVSLNGLATSIFYLLDRKWPQKETVRDVTTQTAQVLLTKDYVFIGPALVNETTLAAFVTAKAATSALNLVRAGVSEVVLRKVKNKERAEKQEKKKIAPAGLVFDANGAVPIAAGD